MKEALLYETNKETSEITCRLCSHYCKIKDGYGGICRVRFNHGGKLYSYNYGVADGVAIDPIEKKPFYHFKPRTSVLSFGAPSCNFKCANCQNSFLSQSIKLKPENLLNAEKLLPSEIVRIANRYRVDGIAYTYSEPTIFFEYARETIQLARKDDQAKDLFHLFVSNGYFSKEMLDLVIGEQLLQAINIDLKFFDDQKYLKVTGGHLGPVLENIHRVYESGIHLEVINLVIPELNDSDQDFQKVGEFLASVSKTIPLHFSRFYPHYKMTERPPTPYSTLLRAREIALSYGLKYVYIGNTNLPEVENTYCPNCNFLVVERQRYFTKTYYKIIGNLAICPNCKEKLDIIL